jgi:putative phosphoesterase
MKIAVFSDVHDNIHNLSLILNKIKNDGITIAIFLGDFTAPGTSNIIFEFCKNNKIEFHGIFGNCDGEKARIFDAATKNGIHMFFREYGELTLAGKKIFLIHYPDFARQLAKSGDYDVVFYGDDHIKHFEVLENGCILANPGEVSTHKYGICSFLIWNTEDNSVEFVDMKESLKINK